MPKPIPDRPFAVSAQHRGQRTKARRIHTAWIGATLVAFTAVSAGWPTGLNSQATEDREPSAETLTRYSFGAEGRVQWALPNRLREISGLATTADDRLFAHNDERAVIYEIDVSRQLITKEFALRRSGGARRFRGTVHRLRPVLSRDQRWRAV